MVSAAASQTSVRCAARRVSSDRIDTMYAVATGMLVNPQFLKSFVIEVRFRRFAIITELQDCNIVAKCHNPLP